MGGGVLPPLSHDPPCPYCGHAFHRFLPCDDDCDCDRRDRPGYQEPR